MRARGVLLAFFLAALALAGLYWSSALLSVRQLETGLRERDVVKLQKYVDWPAVREHLRAKLHDAVIARLDNWISTDSSVETLAGALVSSALLPAIDARLE